MEKIEKVLVGGSFDMLHPGHIELFSQAKAHGNYLIVMLTSDERLKYKKHKALPIYNQEDRRTIVGSLKMVDEAIIIHEAGQINIALKALRQIRPDVYFRTNEVNPETLAEEVKLCQELNIKIVLVNRFPGARFRSSSRIIKYILDNFTQEEMEKLIEADETK